MSKAKVEGKVKPRCCISQGTGVKCIAAVSSVSGVLILIISTSLIFWKNGDEHRHHKSVINVWSQGSGSEMDPVTAGRSAQGKDTAGHQQAYGSHTKLIYMEPQTIAIMQIFSSMCLFSSHSREFRKFSLTWIVFHFFGVVINIAYLWNLPAWVSISPHELRDNKPVLSKKLRNHAGEYEEKDNNRSDDNDNGGGQDEYFRSLRSLLLNCIGVNICTEIFSILVLVEFLRHPEYSLERV